MKMHARMDCSRRPMEMAMPMAMTLALKEYCTASGARVSVHLL